jgi:hypothetical protein
LNRFHVIDVIFPAIDIIRQELVAGGVSAELGNISEIVSDPNNNGVNANVVISLINIEENRISRDPRNYVRKDSTTVIFKNPAIHLNLTLLITSVRRAGGYQLALQDLQQVIGVFQHKCVFDASNTLALVPFPEIEKLTIEMVSLNLQQLHEIWSVLGGRYFPSVVYRLRMVTIDRLDDKPEGQVIKEIELDF